MASRAQRAARGTTAAGFATFIALVSHVAGGGTMPGWQGIVVPFMLALPICMAASGRKPSIPRLTVSVVISQVLFHTLFTLGSPSRVVLLTEASGTHHHGAPVLIVADAVDFSAHGHVGAGMWLGHGIAAVLTIAALYFGERAFLTTCLVAQRMRSWWARLRLTEPASLRLRKNKPVVVPDVRIVRPLGRYFSSLSRRGPPPRTA